MTRSDPTPKAVDIGRHPSYICAGDLVRRMAVYGCWHCCPVAGNHAASSVVFPPYLGAMSAMNGCSAVVDLDLLRGRRGEAAGNELVDGDFLLFTAVDADFPAQSLGDDHVKSRDDQERRGP